MRCPICKEWVCCGAGITIYFTCGTGQPGCGAKLRIVYTGFPGDHPILEVDPDNHKKR